jgi:transposase InsO family protein
VLDDETREKIALFRYGLIGDLIHRPAGEKGLYALLDQKAKKSYEIPGTLRTQVAPETIRDWLTAYRRGGFEALRPKPRRDQGLSRSIPQNVADLLCSLKEDKPALSVEAVIAQVRKSSQITPDLPLAPSTVHRLLSRHGLMERSQQPTSKDRRRFAFDKANELWMSDVMHGPRVFDVRRKRKTYLLALLDDATRVVPYAAFRFAENVVSFLPVFLQALRRRGLPKRLYVDNGSAYRSKRLALVCAKLGVTLIHARPYQPQGKGKLERWFRSTRMQLLPQLGEADFGSLAALNRRLWAWVEGEYHMRPHRGLDGDTPLDRWAMSAQDVQLPGADLEEQFLFEEKRRVHRDRTVSLRGVVFEVEAVLVGETVTLRFDPERLLRGVDVYYKGRKVHQAKPVDAYANCFVRRDHNTKALEPQRPAKSPPPGLKLRRLRGED